MNQLDNIVVQCCANCSAYQIRTGLCRAKARIPVIVGVEPSAVQLANQKRANVRVEGLPAPMSPIEWCRDGWKPRNVQARTAQPPYEVEDLEAALAAQQQGTANGNGPEGGTA